MGHNMPMNSTAPHPIPSNPEPIKQVPYQKRDTVYEQRRVTGYVKVRFTSCHFRAAELPPFPYRAISGPGPSGIAYAALVEDGPNVCDTILRYFPDALVSAVEHNAPYAFSPAEELLGNPVMGTIRDVQPDRSWLVRFWQALKV